MSSKYGEGGTTRSSTAAKSKIRLFGRKHKDAAPSEEDGKDDVETEYSSLQKEEGKVQEEPPALAVRTRLRLTLKKLHLMTPLIGPAAAHQADTEVDLFDVVTQIVLQWTRSSHPNFRIFERFPLQGHFRIGEMGSTCSELVRSRALSSDPTQYPFKSLSLPLFNQFRVRQSSSLLHVNFASRPKQRRGDYITPPPPAPRSSDAEMETIESRLN
jgi:hypothetical protein